MTRKDSRAMWSGKEARSVPVKYWEIIADNLKQGWNCGCVSAMDSNGQKIWIADAHRDRKRFVVHAEEKLTVFAELEAAIRRLKANYGP